MRVDVKLPGVMSCGSEAEHDLILLLLLLKIQHAWCNHRITITKVSGKGVNVSKIRINGLLFSKNHEEEEAWVVYQQKTSCDPGTLFHRSTDVFRCVSRVPSVWFLEGTLEGFCSQNSLMQEPHNICGKRNKNERRRERICVAVYRFSLPSHHHQHYCLASTSSHEEDWTECSDEDSGKRKGTEAHTEKKTTRKHWERREHNARRERVMCFVTRDVKIVSLSRFLSELLLLLLFFQSSVGLSSIQFTE